MKRDLDLARQLLIDIESHGADCALSALRPGVAGEMDERLRYHVRLLIDAGYVKETDHPTNGIPCVRLTNAGHEFLELAFCDSRWREAKWSVLERTGALSLTVLKAVLTRWALEATSHDERLRPRPQHQPTYHQVEARYIDPRFYAPRYTAPRFEPRYRIDPEPVFYRRRKNVDMGNDELRLASARTSNYLERFDWKGTRDWPRSYELNSTLDWRDGDRDAYTRDLYSQNLYAQDLRATSYAPHPYTPVDEYSGALPIHVV